MAARAAVIAGIGQTEYSKNSGRSTLQLAAEASVGRDPRRRAHPVRDRRWGHVHPRRERRTGVDAVSRDPRAALRRPHSRWRRWGVRDRPTRGPGGDRRARRGGADLAGVQRTIGTPVRSADHPPPDPAWNLYKPFGLDTPAKIYGLAFHRYMQTYGLTNEDFGRYTVVARDWAATNPDAWFHDRPITLAEHQASRWIVEPILRLLDCCQESDGGVALVVTTAERAADLDCRPVDVLAAARRPRARRRRTVQLLPPRPRAVRRRRRARRRAATPMRRRTRARSTSR